MSISCYNINIRIGIVNRENFMNLKLIAIFACLVLFLSGCCNARASDECGSCGGCTSANCETTYVSYDYDPCDSCADYSYTTSNCSSCSYDYSNCATCRSGKCMTSNSCAWYENCFDNVGCNDFQDFSCAKCSYY